MVAVGCSLPHRVRVIAQPLQEQMIMVSQASHKAAAVALVTDPASHSTPVECTGLMLDPPILGCLGELPCGSMTNLFATRRRSICNLPVPARDRSP